MPSLFRRPGPDLPPFRTLFVKGDYYPLSPLHLCLSCLKDEVASRAVIITPRRDRLVDALRNFGDGDDGFEQDPTLSEVLSRVQLFYPPSPTHFSLLLSMLRVPGTAEDRSGSWLNSRTTLAAIPSIVVLHELSSYFTDNRLWTISSYLSLVAHGLSFVSQFSGDSGLLQVANDKANNAMWKQP